MSKILELMESQYGQIIVSVILGFGLATLFRKACKDKSCYVIKGPKLSDVNDYYYKMDGRCYKYKPVATSCKSPK